MTKQKHFYLIRGLIREKAHWGEFTDYLLESFPDAKITALDLPGAGSYYQIPSPTSIKTIVEKMRRDYLSVTQSNEEPHLVAISLGGMISIEWLRLYPQDFQSVFLINTSFGGISPFYERLRFSALLHLLKVFILKGRNKEARILELVSNHKDKFHQTLDLWELIQQERPVSMANTIKQLLAAAQFRIGEFNPNIPVFILAATQDRMVDVECSRAIARKWQVPIVEHATAGHDLTVDDPAWVAKKIWEFNSRPVDA